MKINNVMKAMLVVPLFFFASCEKDGSNDATDNKGNVTIEITDAPADDASIQGVFVTVADLKVNGQSIEGFNRTTLDLMAYQNGHTRLLGDAELEAQSYSNVTLVLDFETDMNGNSPGCYVKDNNESKHPLLSNSSELNLEYDFVVEQDGDTELVLDFDLRKTIKRGTGDVAYEFVSSSEMETAIRVVSRNRAGVITGNCTGFSGSDVVIVYAYKKGSFDRDVETQGSAHTQLQFHNAVNSSRVDAQGNYELHFLHEGDYELHFAAYEVNSASGRLELKGTLIIDPLNLIDIFSVSVEAESSTVVDVELTGIVPV